MIVFRSLSGLGLSGAGSSGTFNLDHISGSSGRHNASGSFGDTHSFGLGTNTFPQNYPLTPHDPFEESELPKGTFHLDDFNKKRLFTDSVSSTNTKSESGSRLFNSFFSNFKNDVGKWWT